MFPRPIGMLLMNESASPSGPMGHPLLLNPSPPFQPSSPPARQHSRSTPQQTQKQPAMREQGHQRSVTQSINHTRSTTVLSPSAIVTKQLEEELLSPFFGFNSKSSSPPSVPSKSNQTHANQRANQVQGSNNHTRSSSNSSSSPATTSSSPPYPPRRKGMNDANRATTVAPAVCLLTPPVTSAHPPASTQAIVNASRQGAPVQPSTSPVLKPSVSPAMYSTIVAARQPGSSGKETSFADKEAAVVQTASPEKPKPLIPMSAVVASLDEGSFPTLSAAVKMPNSKRSSPSLAPQMPISSVTSTPVSSAVNTSSVNSVSSSSSSPSIAPQTAHGGGTPTLSSNSNSPQSIFSSTSTSTRSRTIPLHVFQGCPVEQIPDLFLTPASSHHGHSKATSAAIQQPTPQLPQGEFESAVLFDRHQRIAADHFAYKATPNDTTDASAVHTSASPAVGNDSSPEDRRVISNTNPLGGVLPIRSPMLLPPSPADDNLRTDASSSLVSSASNHARSLEHDYFDFEGVIRKQSFVGHSTKSKSTNREEDHMEDEFVVVDQP